MLGEIQGADNVVPYNPELLDIAYGGAKFSPLIVLFNLLNAYRFRRLNRLPPA